MPKKILIALDYSPPAEKVADTGYRFAKSMEGEVSLLHVVGDINYYSSVQYTPILGFDSFLDTTVQQSITIEELKSAAQQFLDQSKKHLKDDTIQTILKEGEVSRAILETAKALPADLIIMGTHGRRGIDKVLMGSVAEKVLHHSEVPVLIIPIRE